MTQTKNLGLIKAIHVGTTPPNNQKMIWFDDNPGVKLHKYYDFVAGDWALLNAPPVGSFDKNQLIPIPSPVTSLTVTHTLNKLASIVVVDTTGLKVNCQIRYDLNDVSKIYVDFESPQDGFIILN